MVYEENTLEVVLNHQFFSKNGGFPNLDDDPKPLVKICKHNGETWVPKL